NEELFFPSDTPIGKVNPKRLYSILKKRYARQKQRLLQQQISDLRQFHLEFQKKYAQELSAPSRVQSHCEIIEGPEFLAENSDALSNFLSVIATSTHVGNCLNLAALEQPKQEELPIMERQHRVLNMIQRKFKDQFEAPNDRHQRQYKTLENYHKEELNVIPIEYQDKPVSPPKDDENVEGAVEVTRGRRRRYLDYKSRDDDRDKRAMRYCPDEHVRKRVRSDPRLPYSPSVSPRSSAEPRSPNRDPRRMPAEARAHRFSPADPFSYQLPSRPDPIPTGPRADRRIPPQEIPTGPRADQRQLPQEIPTGPRAEQIPSGPRNNSFVDPRPNTRPLPYQPRPQQKTNLQQRMDSRQRVSTGMAGPPSIIKIEPPNVMTSSSNNRLNTPPTITASSTNIRPNAPSPIAASSSNNRPNIRPAVGTSSSNNNRPGAPPTIASSNSNTRPNAPPVIGSSSSNNHTKPLFRDSGKQQSIYRGKTKLVCLMDKGTLQIRSKPDRVIITGPNGTAAYGDPRDYDDAINNVNNPNNPIQKRFMSGDVYLFHKSDSGKVEIIGPVYKIQPLIHRFFLSR
ncbi:hypothetical protein CU098_003333, partial [Rhizopus stolonifer]